MKKTIRTLILTAAVLLAGVSASAQQFNQIFFFGDSLTDVGNHPPESPWTNGHGSLWSNDLAANYGLNIKASSLGGTDYAVYGYTSGMILNTVQELVSKSPQLNSKSLYAMWSGSNDLLLAVEAGIKEFETTFSPELAAEAFFSALETALATGPGNVVESLKLLNNAGGKYIVSVNLPNVGSLPLETELTQFAEAFLTPEEAALFGNALRLAMTEGAMTFNYELSKKINALPFDVIQVDIFSMMNFVLKNPGKFGLMNVTGSICKDPLTDPSCTQLTDLDPNTTLFWDSVHPSVAGHHLIADAVFSYLQGPTMYSLLARAPINIMQAQYSNINTQFLPYQAGEPAIPGQWSVFVAGAYSPQNPGAIDTTKAPGFKSNNQNLTVGVVHHVHEAVSIGAAFGPSFGRTKVDGLYQFDLMEPTVTLFGQVRPWRSYANVLVSYGLPTYHGIQRTVHIGPAAVTSNKASTKGQHLAAATNLGFNVYEHPSFTTGPVAGLEYQYLKVGGYVEHGLIDGLNLDYFDQKNQTLTSNAGWQATYTTPVKSAKLLVNGQAKFNYQHLGGDKDIRFGTASLPGSHGAVPVRFPKGGYGTAGGSIGAELANKMRLLVSAMTVFGDKSFSQQIYSLSAEFPL